VKPNARPMLCPCCNTFALDRIDHMDGFVGGRCRACKGWWCSFKQAMQLGVIAQTQMDEANNLKMAICPGCSAQSLAPVSAVIAVAIRPLACKTCCGIWIQHATMSQIKAKPAQEKISAADNSLEAINKAKQMLRQHGIALADDEDVLANNRAMHEYHPLMSAAAIPVCALAVWLICLTQIGKLVQFATVGMWLHELGHAVAAWLSGSFAIPLLFFTFTTGKQTIFVVLAVIAAAFLMLWKGWRQRLPFWLILGGISLCMLFAKAVLLDDAQRAIWISYSGIGGELVLGTLCIVSFFYTVYRRPSWKLMRYAALFLGMAVFLPEWLNWIAISAGTEPFPLGSLIHGSEEGDMNRLLASGLTQADIIESYLSLAHYCLFIIIAHWAWLVVRTIKILKQESQKNMPAKTSRNT
jgi:hypothetical protein